MKPNYKGFLLLETMVAMVVIVTGILFMVSTITFILSENKRCEEELEMAIILYEMACSNNQEGKGQQEIYNKSLDKNMRLTTWENDHLRIESDALYLEIKANK